MNNYIKIGLFEYLPEKYLPSATFEETNMHFAILDFKDGRMRAQEWAADVVTKALSGKDRSPYVFVCIPAHCHATYVRRYKEFSQRVCQGCGCQNGFPHVFVKDDKKPTHLKTRRKDWDALDNVIIDRDFFNGKKVIIFDDIITTGRTADKMAEMLTSCGARVVGGLFLAKTIRPRGQ